MRFFFFLVTLFVIKFKADAMEIECSFMIIGSYACDVQSFKQSSSDDCEVENVIGDHHSGKFNSDVLFFHTGAKGFTCFPKKLEKFFKNLNKLVFHYEKFSILTKSDLQPFGSRLKNFWFYGTELEVIPADLFEDTRNLEFIYLYNNKIKHVERGTFDKLKNLTTLYFNNNPCHSGDARNRADVLKLITQIERKCSDEEAFTRYKNQFTTTTEVPTTTVDFYA